MYKDRRYWRNWEWIPLYSFYNAWKLVIEFLLQKKEAINYTVEFFVERLGLDINNIYASVFEGDEDAPQDTVSIESMERRIFSKIQL